MAKKKVNRYAQQAADLTLVRYGPEISALSALLRDAQATRQTGLTQAKASRQAGVRAVFDAMPRVQHAYEGAGQAVAPAFVQGGGIEASALTSRLGEAGALARSQLEDRRVAAVQGEGSARQQILRDYRQDKGKIQERALDLGRESGAFTASTILQLLGDATSAKARAATEAANRLASRGNAWIAAGVDPTTGKAIPGGRLDPNAPQNRPKPAAAPKPAAGEKWTTPIQQGKASDVIHQALSEARTLKATGANRHEAAQMLLHGVEAVGGRPVYRTVVKRGRRVQERVLNPDGTQKMTGGVPGVPQIKEQLYLTAALDMAYLGHLSKTTQDLLHRRRVKIGPLGVTTYGDYQRKVAAARGNLGGSSHRPRDRPYYGPSYGR